MMGELLRQIEYTKSSQSSGVEAFMIFAYVAAAGGVI